MPWASWAGEITPQEADRNRAVGNKMETASMAVGLMMPPGDMISMYMDSTAVVAFVNRQGGTCSRILNSSAQRLWKKVFAKGGWIKAHWLSRDLNDLAGYLSKYSLEEWDFCLKAEVAEGLWKE